MQNSLENICVGVFLISLWQNDTPTQMVSRKFMKLLKHHFHTFKNIIFTKQLRTAASVFIEHNFNIKKPYFNWCQEKKTRKKNPYKGLGLLVLQNFFTSVVKES